MLTKDILYFCTMKRSCVPVRTLRTLVLSCNASSTTSSLPLSVQSYSTCGPFVQSTGLIGSNTMVQQVRCKGHAHWQNVAKDKRAGDLIRATVRTRLHYKITCALKAGGADPKFNKELEKTMKECQTSNVPKDVVQRWIAGFMESRSSGSSFLELNGPKGIVFVLKLSSDAHPVKFALQRLSKKVNAIIPKSQRWEHIFDQKGVVTVPVTKDMDVTNIDKYIEIAIECGAEDVIVTGNDGQVPNVDRLLKFHCDPHKLDEVAKEIQDTSDLEVHSKEVDLIPHTFAIIETEDEAKYCQAVKDKMYTNEDVIKIYDNVTLPEE